MKKNDYFCKVFVRDYFSISVTTKMIKYLAIILLTLLFSPIYAQYNYIAKRDSITKLIHNSESDTAKIRLYFNLIDYSDNHDTTLHYLDELINVARSANDSVAIARCLMNYGYTYHNVEKFNEAEEALSEVVRIARKKKWTKYLANAYYLLSVCCESQDNIAGLLDYGNKALDIYKQTNDTVGIIRLYNVLGQTCGLMNMYQPAYEYLIKAMQLSSMQGKETETGDALIFYAAIMLQQFDNEIYNDDVKKYKFLQVIKYCNAVLKWYHRLPQLRLYLQEFSKKTYITLARSYIRLAYIANNPAYADSSAKYIAAIKEIRSNNITLLQESVVTEAEWLVYQRQYNQAISQLSQFEKETEHTRHTTALLKQTCALLAECYAKTNNLEKSLQYLNKADYYEKANIRESTDKQYADFQSKMITEKQKELIEAENERNTIKKQAEIRRQNLIITTLVGSLLIMLISTTIIINSLKRNRETNRKLTIKNNEISTLNKEIIRQKDEIEKQRDIITMQFDIVESTNESITSNIKYASKIQRAIIPTEEDVKQVFSNSFVYFHPKDIVSGDFYTTGIYNGIKVFIIADCTGHGVPGGLLSMLGITAVNDILQANCNPDDFNPGLVLDNLKSFILSTFESKYGYEIYDGMDMTICAFDPQKNILHFASANQSAFLLENGVVSRLKGDKMPVGKYIKDNTKFSSKTINIKPGSTIYLTSDGMIDQLGGPFGKKFLIKNFVTLIEKMGNLPIEKQKSIIETTINEWKGNTPQIDDITIVGIKLL